MTSRTVNPTTRSLPGLAVAFAVAAGAMLLARAVPLASPALTTVVAGMVAANAGWLPPVIRPGLAVAAKRVLRIGIILLGLQLAVGDVLALGGGVVGIVVAVVAGGIGVGLFLGRVLGIPWAEVVLIGCGFSICGAAAVAAAGGALDTSQDAEDRARLESQMAIALALVVLMGTLMIAIVPALTVAFDMGEFTAGVVAGGSIHEVAQVVAVGSIIGGSTLGVAVLVKLGRVVLLAPTIAIIAAMDRRRTTRRGDGAAPPIVPLWVVGFLGAIAIRSTGVLPAPMIDAAVPVQVLTLAAAMFALGTGARFELIKQVGLRPVILAIAITAAVLGISLAGAQLLT